MHAHTHTYMHTHTHTYTYTHHTYTQHTYTHHTYTHTLTHCQVVNSHIYSGVGTVAAVATLAATLFSPMLIFIALTLKF